MRHLIAIAALTLMLVGIASAKDKDYQTGTVSKDQISNGWVDTTVCGGSVGYVHCSGGIQDSYEAGYTLTKSDGTKVFITHAPLHRDILKDMADGVTVQYRTKHVGGLTSYDYVYIAGPDGKESAYVVVTKN